MSSFVVAHKREMKSKGNDDDGGSVGEMMMAYSHFALHDELRCVFFL
jgi:hypothetical protein